MKSKYYKKLDFIRIISCILVLLYHLNFLKGGYLAVCIFFVLSGYLSCTSAFAKKKDFTLKNYYLSRLKKIYIPMLIVVLITIALTSIVPVSSWLNLKPESISVLCGYNNFWQLNANLDYFARHVNSPFIHLWYISILLQFDLIFPLLFKLFRKVGNTFKRKYSCLIPFVLGIISASFFTFLFYKKGLMHAYYNTFARIFSLLFGVALGFYHTYFRPLIFRNKKIRNILFYFYILISIIMSIFIEATSVLFVPAMIIISLITCRLIDYSVCSFHRKLSKNDRIVKTISGPTYIFYLVQYPIIYMFQYLELKYMIKVFLMILLMVIVTILLAYTMKKQVKIKVLQYILIVIILISSGFGTYRFIITEDHTKEMKELEKELAENEKIMLEKQKEYEKRLQDEEKNWQETLKQFEDNEGKLKEMVGNLPVVGVGDSVMLGAVENLYGRFPNGYFDAKLSRTAWVLKGILEDLKNKKMLGEPIVLNFGANGDCPEYVKEEFMKTIDGRQVFWINATNDKDVHVNKKISDFAAKYDNLHIIDWETKSAGHGEYFYSDGIHLTESGRIAYTDYIYEEIYNYYLGKLNKQKEEKIKEYEDANKKKIAFYGNSVLLNAFEGVEKNYSNAIFNIDKDYNAKTLIEAIKDKIENETMENRIVLVIDKSTNISKNDYKKIIELCKKYELYIIMFDDTIELDEKDNVKILKFYEEIKNNDDYLAIDKIHLSNKGNQALVQYLISNIN